jgi:ubiquinone biosynthesis protein UbiJ
VSEPIIFGAIVRYVAAAIAYEQRPTFSWLTPIENQEKADELEAAADFLKKRLTEMEAK